MTPTWRCPRWDGVQLAAAPAPGTHALISPALHSWTLLPTGRATALPALALGAATLAHHVLSWGGSLLSLVSHVEEVQGPLE